MPFDQTSPQFLGQLRDLARGIMSWAGQETQEGAHGQQQTDAQPSTNLPPPGPQPQTRPLALGGNDLNQPPPMQTRPGQQNAAGMLLLAPDGRALFVRRAANARDHAGQWSIPGGMTEGDENPWQTAMRETTEEVGDCFGGGDCDTGQLLDHSVGDTGVGFTTFGGRVNDAFQPVLTDEHDAFQWANLDQAPQPMHPGLQATLDFAQDPLTEKGSKIMRSMKSQYGPEKGERVFYASKNAGKISGVDNTGPHERPVFPRLGQGQTANTAFSANLDAGGGAGGWGHQGVRPPNGQGTWQSPRWGTNDQRVVPPQRGQTQPLQQTDADLAKRFRLLDTHTGQTHDLNLGGRDVGTPQGAPTKYFGVGANTSRDVGTAEGARKAAATRRAGSSAQQPPRAAPGSPRSGQFTGSSQQRTPAQQAGREAGRQLEAAYPWGYRSRRDEGEEDQSLTGPGSGTRPPPKLGDDTPPAQDDWASPAWDAGGGAGGWGHGGLTPPQHDAFQAPGADPMTRPADQGTRAPAGGMPRPLGRPGGMRGAGMGMSGMGGGPKYTHSIKMDYGGGTVDERKFTRPMPTATPPMQAEQMDAGQQWASPQWGQQDQSSAVPTARTVGPAAKGAGHGMMR